MHRRRLLAAFALPVTTSFPALAQLPAAPNLHEDAPFWVKLATSFEDRRDSGFSLSRLPPVIGLAMPYHFGPGPRDVLTITVRSSTRDGLGYGWVSARGGQGQGAARAGQPGRILLPGLQPGAAMAVAITIYAEQDVPPDELAQTLA